MTRPRIGRVKAPDFMADFESDGRVIRADHQISYMKGWTDQEVRDYVARKGWKVNQVLGPLDQAERDPLVKAVMSAFPGAEVIAVRRPPTLDGPIEPLDPLLEHEET